MNLQCIAQCIQTAVEETLSNKYIEHMGENRHFCLAGRNTIHQWLCLHHDNCGYSDTDDSGQKILILDHFTLHASLFLTFLLMLLISSLEFKKKTTKKTLHTYFLSLLHHSSTIPQNIGGYFKLHVSLPLLIELFHILYAGWGKKNKSLKLLLRFISIRYKNNS